MNSLVEAALTRLLDGEPEPGDGELLAQAMREDAALRREVSGLLAVDDLLRQNAELSEHDFTDALAERLADDADESFARRVQTALPSQHRSRQKYRWQFAAAALFLIGIAVFTFRVTRDAQADVATLLLAENCEWQQPIQEGRRVIAGPLHLRRGLAVLRFDGGAELILRGETEVELQSAGQARLVHGDVTVRAPEEAAGFKLLTPASEVVDLGTEFAAKVERSGATEVHVIEGEIALQSVSGGHSEILPAGKAVRFDNAKMAAHREVPMHAERFEEIVRAARPAARADLLFAYESFSYRPGRHALTAINSGLGWRGSWRTATKNEAYRTPEDPTTDLNMIEEGTRIPWPLPEGQPGMLELPAGTRSFVRTMAKPIALDKDGVTYFSFMVREADLAAGSTPREYGGVRLVFRSSTSPTGELVSFGPSRVRRPGIRMGDGQTFMSPVEIPRNQNTLWVGKIISRRHGDDEFFFSVYGERDAFSFAEPATWQTASRGVRRNGRLDLALISTQLSAPCIVDELRIGPTWRSIAPVQELSFAALR